ncbi:PHP-associated domain-containing protein [Sulfuracidifex tepidarius]|uniref:PHP-associated domain-containing protein n=1 Tax=Sulfuracidifex tepidarius TaxID=1294262 RepID=UPI0006D24A85
MFIDFHTHTFFSDGKASPKEMFETAKKKGIFISITDHDTSKGIKEVNELPVIPGQEVTTQFGHVVILCNFPPSPPSDIKGLVDYAKENSCVVFPSHPFDIFRAGIGDHVFDYKFDAIETFNSKANRVANGKAKEAALKLDLPGLADSDSHVPSAIGSAYNAIELSEFNVDDILDSVRKKKSKPVEVGLSGKAKLDIVVWHIQRKLKK